MTWQEEYKTKLVSAEDAVSIVKSGDKVCVPMCLELEPQVTLLALGKRRNELDDVEIFVQSPQTDCGWFVPERETSFLMNIWATMGRPAHEAMNRRTATLTSELFSLSGKMGEERGAEIRRPDVCIVTVSTPNEQGYCSFGNALWNKKTIVSRAKKVIGEVRKDLIRTYGDNSVPVSDIDYFVEGTASVQKLILREPPAVARDIAGYVSSLIRNGDTVQVGWGMPVDIMRLGAFDGKRDLGMHTEVIPRGTMRLVKQGVFTGSRKTVNRGKLVGTSIVTDDQEELRFFDNNPICELYDVAYTNDIRVIAAHDNMVGLCSALSVDLGGQSTAETMFGSIVWNGAGGLPEFAIGVPLSKGGRFIIAMPSATQDGAVSRIVPAMDEGAVVTIPRYLADYVVTEYGIARLWGKSLRQRADELINIAHPGFRADLKKAAMKTLYP